MALDCQSHYYLNEHALPIISENSSLKLTVGEKVYWEGPFTYVTGRIEAFAAATTNPMFYEKYGVAAVQPVILQGKHTVDINPLQSFFAEWQCDTLSAAELALATPAANTALRFQYSLKGLLRRPVQ